MGTGDVATATDIASEPYWQQVIHQEQTTLRITPNDLREAMDAYDGAADLWQTYTLEGMNLYDVIAGEDQNVDYAVEIGCNSGKTTRELAELLPETGVMGVDLYRQGSFTHAGPEYVQAEAVYLPFQDDSIDLMIAPSSLGAILKMGVLHDISRRKLSSHDRIKDVLGQVEPRDRSRVRESWATACVSQYVQDVLTETGRVASDNGALLLADGQLYLHAELRDGNWYALEGRGYVKDWDGGGETVRHARNYYGSWLQQMDDSEYTEKTHTIHVPSR